MFAIMIVEESCANHKNSRAQDNASRVGSEPDFSGSVVAGGRPATLSAWTVPPWMMYSPTSPRPFATELILRVPATRSQVNPFFR